MWAIKSPYHIFHRPHHMAVPSRVSHKSQDFGIIPKSTAFFDDRLDGGGAGRFVRLLTVYTVSVFGLPVFG